MTEYSDLIFRYLNPNSNDKLSELSGSDLQNICLFKPDNLQVIFFVGVIDPIRD